jgi:hypothetical protein
LSIPAKLEAKRELRINLLRRTLQALVRMWSKLGPAAPRRVGDLNLRWQLTTTSDIMVVVDRDEWTWLSRNREEKFRLTWEILE